MEKIIFSYADTKDLQAIECLLGKCELPYQDIIHHLPHFILAKNETQLVGVIGLEILDGFGLLRSLAVSDSHRGQGLAKTLYYRLATYADKQGIKTLYLLTLTAAGFFAKLGFNRIERETAPKLIQETEEFQNLCPDTAVCMSKDIETQNEYLPEVSKANVI